jgi:SAM-dependent methyltransferase
MGQEMNGTVARLKIPPPELINYTNGHTDVERYRRGAMDVAQQFTLAVNRHAGSLDCQGPILDFGCGSGRLLGALDFGRAEVKACDVGAAVAEFSRKAYPDFDVQHTSLMPPLPFPRDYFGLIYAFSVFSHLPEDIEQVWLAELVRIARSGCLFLLTIHGDWVIEATLPIEKRNEVASKGFDFMKVHSRDHNGLQFPDYYECSYHTSTYVLDKWKKYFDILEIVKGDNPRRHLAAGLSFVSEGGSIPDFQPMGQDLVIARKR